MCSDLANWGDVASESPAESLEIQGEMPMSFYWRRDIQRIGVRVKMYATRTFDLRKAGPQLLHLYINPTYNYRYSFIRSFL